MSSNDSANGSAAKRWHVLVAGFVCYGFDAVDFMMLPLPEAPTVRDVSGPPSSDPRSGSPA